MSAEKNRWQRLFQAVLAINALSASLVVVGLVVVLSVWVYSVLTQQASDPHVPSRERAEPQRIDVPVVSDVNEPKSVAAVAAAPDQREEVSVRAAPTPSSTSFVPVILPPEHHSEVELNRAMGKALSSLAKDPELRRKLGINLPP